MKSTSPHRSSIVEEILAGRGALAELFVAAVLLALGVNVLASAIAAILGISNEWLLLLGLSMVLLAFALISRKLIEKRCVQRSFKGLLAHRKKDNVLVKIPRYDFTESLTSYLQSLFAENEAMKKLWDKEPLSGIFDYDKESQKLNLKNVASKALIEEATEYYLLNRLSTHVTDFFNQSPFDDALLKEFGREDVPSVLFKNRFLDTFSRPMIERPAFVDSAMADKSNHGRIVASFGPNNARFESFDLVLPREAKVTRVSDRRIEIDTPKFCLHLEVNFPGVNTTLPRGFEKLYLEEEDQLSLSVYQIEVRISVEFKALALLTRAGWEYHMWLDSFIASFERRFAYDSFFEMIDWDRAMTVARVMQRASTASKVSTNVPQG
jgi:hypothetical protein